ncbi:major facilitator superfamily domain-containing protein [Pisolithus sp. B1]|nr:major facilitator superfamily domain-containing protein [Pisolithus sp. B1]
MALGFVSIGSSLGGILFPIAGQNLIPLVGFKWTVRVFGFMMLVSLGITNLTIDRRLPPVNVKGGFLNLPAFRNPAYTIYCLSGIACCLGLYTMLTYLPVSATAVGMSSNFSFYLVAISNAASGFGRLSAGFLADRIGPLNAMIPFTGLAGIITFAWPYASSRGALIGVSVLYGITSGTYVSLLVAPAMAMGGVGDVGRRVGMFLTIAALGTLVGTPISGAINARTGGFKDPGFYAGEYPPLHYFFLLRCFPLSIAPAPYPFFLFIFGVTSMLIVMLFGRWYCHIFSLVTLRGTISPTWTVIREVLVSYGPRKQNYHIISLSTIRFRIFSE